MLSSSPPKMNCKYITIDTETTGLSAGCPDLPLSIAGVVMDGNGRVIEAADFLILPPRCRASPFCVGWPTRSEFHRVGGADAARHGVPFLLAIAEISRMARSHDVEYVVAYNAKFDRGMIQAWVRLTNIDPSLHEFLSLPWQCAYEQARRALVKQATSFKLSHVYTLLFGDEEELDWHDAYADAVAAGKVYALLRARFDVSGTDRRTLVRILCGAPTKKPGNPACRNMRGSCRYHAA